MSDPEIPVGALGRWDGEKWVPVSVWYKYDYSDGWVAHRDKPGKMTPNPFKVK